MKYQKQLEQVASGALSREKLNILRGNAVKKFQQGDDDAKAIIDAIDSNAPSDSRILFMGFCPGGTFENRLDLKWKEEGICRFDFPDEKQQAKFDEICAGDLVVLKKREIIGKTMKVYGHGRVTRVSYDENDVRYLEMAWASQDEVIEVPLLWCNSTVEIRSIEDVEDGMPQEFFDWLAVV